MNLEQIRAAFEASRRRDMEFHGATLSLLLPTEQEVRAAYIRDRAADITTVTRRILASMVTGWENVTLGLVMRTTMEEMDGQETAMPYSLDLADVWLSNDVELYDRLFGLLDEYRDKQAALRVDEAKKSPLTTSPQLSVVSAGN